MRNENSQPPSRSQSPSLYGAPRTSSASPMPFYPQSISRYSGTSTYGASRPKRQFVSHLVTGEIDKPWLKRKDRWLQAAWWVTVLLWFLGVVGTAILCFFTYRNIPHLPKDLCLVMNEQFSSNSIDSNNWNHEVSVSGFGNGGFEWTTDSQTNSFVQGGKLYIVPTLTSEGGKYSADQILNGVNDKIDGCTDGDDSNAYFKDKVVGSAGRTGQHDPCQVTSDRSSRVAVNPVQSARLTTRGKHTIKYGRVEIRAKMPTGDWLFPQIMMLPASTVYGNWPLSGEIDLVMARGNDANYQRGGRDFVTSGLQWGPGVGFNAFDRTRGWYQQRRTNFNQAFHTFAVEWTDKFMWIFVDSRVHRVINLDFKKTNFFQRGKFPQVFRNGTNDQILQNPWRDHNNAAPFDQDFYLVMTVQAGGTNGWFEDRIGKKPWFDRSATAMFDFANATSTWHKTWSKDPKDRAMVIDSVKMWQVGKCGTKSSN
ncbi:concanavalin A-like lectin/glucanase [Auricularia subglabra TFB-10046 SS5]|nr:concanavalin A-like lectin/glucanase [Auricularia subglabra TFB-10046 SS5]